MEGRQGAGSCLGALFDMKADHRESSSATGAGAEECSWSAAASDSSRSRIKDYQTQSFAPGDVAMKRFVSMKTFVSILLLVLCCCGGGLRAQFVCSTQIDTTAPLPAVNCFDSTTQYAYPAADTLGPFSMRFHVVRKSDSTR